MMLLGNLVLIIWLTTNVIINIASAKVAENELEWKEQITKLKKIAEEHSRNSKIQETVHPQHRSTGIEYFNISFACDPKPTSVHRLRPQDIDVVGALGDSLTAANGAEADTIVGVAREYRGISWFAGGEGTVDTALTIPNILRLFNPTIQGYSVGTRFEEGSDWWFNVAVPGARARDIPDQANKLVNKMKNDERTNFDNDWKLVTIFIGGNDLCVIDRSDDAQPKKFVEYLQEALDILHKELPRTLVNVVDILEIYLLPEVGTGFGSTRVCRIAQRALCKYIVTADADDVKMIKKLDKEYQILTEELINSGRYDTKDDFTVVLQPFFRDTHLPMTEDGQVDATFFAPDCFHFGAKGHAMGALNLWNNMFEPVGQKSTVWSISDLKGPTKEAPHIFTNLNSFPHEGSGEAPTASVPSVSTTENPICGNEAADWMIALICLLGAAALAQTFTLLCIALKRRSYKNNFELDSFDNKIQL